MPKKEDPPTLADVAASAGVSIATVSKVLNGRSDVGPATRARVQSLLSEHEYVARRAEAARPEPGEPRTVEVVFHGELSGYAQAILEGVVDGGLVDGVSVVVSVRPRYLQRGDARPAEWIRELNRRRRSAVIDVSDDVREGDLSAIGRARVPLVMVDPLSAPRRDVASIGTTNFSGGMAAAQHLLGLGHTRIAYLGAKPSYLFDRARQHGYRAALEAAGVSVGEGYVRGGGYSYESGVAGGSALLDLPERPTAIFAATDESAAGVIEAARVRGLRVPEDLSLVGFDDAPVARVLSPPLTTIRQPLREMGRVALRTALRLAAGDELDSYHVELATELVVRSSTAPPAG